MCVVCSVKHTAPSADAWGPELPLGPVTHWPSLGTQLQGTHPVPIPGRRGFPWNEGREMREAPAGGLRDRGRNLSIRPIRV